ncbi:MAG: YraN family protein, partial [Planktomarina sp.]
AGLAAEATVAASYTNAGYGIRNTRWCTKEGEIDLVLQDDDAIVFCEVKQSKTHDTAMERITPAKQRRLYRTAEAYLAAHGFDQQTNVRFDVGLVDAVGRVQIVENAFA